MYSHTAIPLDQFSEHWLFLLRSLWMTLLFSNAKLHSESRVAVSCVASFLATNMPYELVLVVFKFLLSFNCRWVLEFDTDFLTLREEMWELGVISKKWLDSEVGTVLLQTFYIKCHQWFIFGLFPVSEFLATPENKGDCDSPNVKIVPGKQMNVLH